MEDYMVEKGGKKGYITERNGRSSWERHGIVAFCTRQWNEWMNTHAWHYVKHIQKFSAIKTKLYLICCIMCSNYANKHDRSRFKLQSLPGSAVFMNFINYYFPIPHVDRYFYEVAVATVITIPQQQSEMLTVRYQYNKHCHSSTSFII
jgi:hypothetical protein